MRSKNQKKSKLKRTLKLVKSANSSKDVPSLSGLSAQNIERPDGFRVVSASQAIMEYASPLMEMVPEPEDIVKANEVLQIATTIWNYTFNDTLKKRTRNLEQIYWL